MDSLALSTTGNRPLASSTTGDGSRVGLFIRVPDQLVAARPSLRRDTSPPHVTFLVIGDVRGREQELLDALQDASRARPSSSRAFMGKLDALTNPQGETVLFQSVRFCVPGSADRWDDFGPLGRLRELIVERLRQRNFPVKDIGVERWIPHMTLSYLPEPRGIFAGPVFEGSWHVSELEVWGLPDEIRLPLDPLAKGLIDLIERPFGLGVAEAARWERLPPWMGRELCQDLSKAAGHKYLRRVPTGKTTSTGRPIYRYFYEVTGGAGLGHRDELKAGAAFKIKHGGREGHFHILRVEGDKVTIRHDESGHETTLRLDALAAMLHREHAAQLGKVRKRASRQLSDALKHGSKKQVARARALARKLGAVSDFEFDGDASEARHDAQTAPSTSEGSATKIRPGALELLAALKDRPGRGKDLGQEDEVASPAPIAPRPSEPPQDDGAVTGAESNKGARLQYKIDAGTHVDGSRADRHGISQARLAAMSPEEAARYVQKARLLPKFDPDAQLARGATPGYLLAHKALLAHVTSRPADSAQARADYLEAIDFLARSLDSLNSAADVQGFLADWRLMSMGLNSLGEFGTYEEAHAAVMRHKRQGDGWLVSEDPRSGKVIASIATGLTQEGGRWRLMARALGKDIERLVRGSATGKWASRLRNSVAHDRAAPTDAKTLRALGEARIFLKTTPKEAGDKAAARRTGGRWDFKRNVGEHLERRGGRPIEQISAEAMRQEFGLGNVQFGNWVSDEDARHHIEACHGALRDLGEVLGIPPEQVSYNGRLSIGIGARGAGRALAHYEPDKQIINLTRFAGGGSLAHEWGHFLDHIAHTVYKPGQGQDPFLSQLARAGKTAGALPPRLHQALSEVWTAIRHAPPGPELARTIQSRRDEAGLKIKEIAAWLDRNRSGAQAVGAGREKLDAYNQRVKEHNDLVRERRALGRLLTRPHSQFFADAMTLSGVKHLGDTSKDAYYTRPHELFARAFEAFVEDQLHAQGRQNSYLVSGTREPYEGRARLLGKGHAQIYPQGEERQRINRAISGLIAALKDEGTLDKALAFQRRPDPLQELLRNFFRACAPSLHAADPRSPRPR